MREPHYTDDAVTLYLGDCLDVLAELPDSSVDSVVTDPPYGLANTSSAQVTEAVTRWTNGERDWLPTGQGFMGKAWDAFVPPVAVWDECIRVLKPGGHLVAFAGSRTYDLMGLSVRLAGFEIRDALAWIYSSGFPKSRDITVDLDRMAGVEREVVGQRRLLDPSKVRMGFAGPQYGTASETHLAEISVATSELARQWEGWGTGLKPALEPVVFARKPLGETSVAANLVSHGVGAINIDGSRVGDTGGTRSTRDRGASKDGIYGDGLNGWGGVAIDAGRWPPNVMFDQGGADELDRTAGDREGASRYFPVFRYDSKAAQHERPRVDGVAHPTVKPLSLMAWLVRLITPPGGVVLEPFAGSGTTAEACVMEGRRCIAIERDPEYAPLIVQRVSKPIQVGLDLGDLGA